jgi:two-component system sensor histidine kinase/response regulator
MKRVLIIDDEEPIRSTMAMILQTAGYETLEAEGGASGLALAREHLPDLTFCDINMPGMDGRAVVEAFRKDPDLATRQIVIITGNPSQTSQRTAMNLGADDYLTKPFTAADVLQCTETRLKRADIHWRVENQALQDLRGSLHTTLPHEFFTPLVGIIGMSELLMEEAGELSRDEIVDLAGNINRSGDRLHRTLRNYLRILELDQMPVSAAAPPAPLSPVQTQSTVTQLTRSVAIRHKREADLALALTPASPVISTDSLGLIVEELADNAFGFSRQGTPVRIEVAAGPDGITLRFTDRGRGMTPEQIEKIGAFQQFDRKRHEQQGLGLGLTLVTRLLQQAGGKLTLVSTPGEGTVATVTLPAGK